MGTEASPNDVTQDTEWNGNWGWRMKKDDRITEFKVSLQIPIKESNDTFTEFETDYLSTFYENADSPYHLVIYAMQWCQPVWDGIEDNPSGEVGAISDSSYIQNADYHGMNMHLATNVIDQGGSDYNGGKGYGKMEACYTGFASKYRSATGPHPGHSGYDIYAPIGAPIFAFRGGTATPGVATNDSTHYVETITWEAINTNAHNNIKHLHLSQDGRVNGHVLTGQKICKAGRSGNLGWTSSLPGHTHLNVGSYPWDDNLRYSSALYHTNQNYVDSWNFRIFPCNDFALVLPCKCQIGNSAAPTQGQFFTCNFDGNNVKQCWAAWELKCPLMRNMNNGTEANPNIRIVQAQLKYLGYYVGPAGPYGLDGDQGPNLNTAIIDYKGDKGLLPIDTNITTELLDCLNEDAPL